jgi:hypothetical protein
MGKIIVFARAAGTVAVLTVHPPKALTLMIARMVLQADRFFSQFAHDRYAKLPLRY